ncbi:HAMP domain-containing histidine kinase [bacterium]|nr:HAMP domain-containing histidine kinase [bacterium]
MKKRSLFTRENERQERNKEIIEDHRHSDSPLYQEFVQLSEDYSKLFKQFSRIVRMSDKAQEQLKESKESIIRYNEELQQLNATKDKFFSIIAHDLKSPFQAFLNLNTFLVKRIDRYSKEEVVELINELGSTADNLFKLLENLLSWSRIQMGKIQLEPNVFPINQLVNMTFDFLISSAKTKRIKLINNISNEISVYADPNMVSTILRNLISNAIKFTQENGKITINSQIIEGGIQVEVTDTGVGMSEKDREKLFRIEVTHTTPGTADEKGTGLGLILCKEMIEKHNGEIWVESEPGVGTTFFFSLKLQSSEIT